VWFAGGGGMASDFAAHFDRSYLNGLETLEWISHRKWERVGHLDAIKLQEFLDFKRRQMMYDATPRNPPPAQELPPIDCEQMLLGALLEGKITAYRKGEPLRREFWMGKSPKPSEWAAYHFWRNDLIAIWKADGSTAKFSKPKPAPKRDEIARQLAVFGLDKDRGGKSLKEIAGMIGPKGNSQKEEAAYQRRISRYYQWRNSSTTA
jgi:hypothetical protein